MQWKWQRIRTQIAAGGAAAARAYARMGREIAAAGRGNPDPDTNDALAAALERARGYGMSEAAIVRALDSAASSAGVPATRLRLEAAGPAGIAFVIDALTDDAARTEHDLGALLAAHGARIEGHAAANPEDGDTADDRYEDEYGHEHEEDDMRFSGLSTLGQTVLDEPTAYRVLLGAGLEGFMFLDQDRPVLCQCPTEQFAAVRAAFVAAGVDGFELVEHELEPLEYIELPRPARASLEALVDALERCEDVLYVYHNVDLDEAPDEHDANGAASPIDAQQQALFEQIRTATGALRACSCHGTTHVYGAGMDVVETTRLDLRLAPDHALRYVTRVQGNGNAFRPGKEVIAAGGRTYLKWDDEQAWEQLEEPAAVATMQHSVAALFAPERLRAVAAINVRELPGELHVELRFDAEQLARISGRPEVWVKEDYVVDVADMLPKTLATLLVKGQDAAAITVESKVTFAYDRTHDDIVPPAMFAASSA